MISSYEIKFKNGLFRFIHGFGATIQVVPQQYKARLPSGHIFKIKSANPDRQTITIDKAGWEHVEFAAEEIEVY